MRLTAVVTLLLILGFSVWANEIRHRVERSSDVERELGYKLSIQDKHDAWRAEGLDKVFPIKGPGPEYMVRFHATTTGKLKDLFGLTLTLTGADGMLVQVPLAVRSKWEKDNEVSVQFLIKKDMINRAELTVRCGLPNLEESYVIRLSDHVPEQANP